MKILNGLVVLLIIFPASPGFGDQRGDTGAYIAATLAGVQGLEQAESGMYSKAAAEYFAHYGLVYGNVEHRFGTFNSQGYTLAGHIFTPKQYTAVVVVMHGYCDHSGLLSGIIGHLLSQGYAVAAFDLPGHGLSNGEDLGIHSFSEYTAILGDFVALCKRLTRGPVHAIGHSTGGAIVADYVLSGKADDIQKVVLVAPLVHSCMWGWSKAGTVMVSPFTRHVPRVFRTSTSDKAFLEFTKHNDPLQRHRLPLGWTRALYQWNKEFAGCRPVNKEALILQGKRDTVVDWRYNIPVLESKFPKHRITFFDSGNHQLFNESEPTRAEVFKTIAAYLAL